MKIKIKKNWNQITFHNAYFHFSIHRDCIYFFYHFKEHINYRNWIYDEDIKNENKNIIEIEHKKYIK